MKTIILMGIVVVAVLVRSEPEICTDLGSFSVCEKSGVITRAIQIKDCDHFDLKLRRNVVIGPGALRNLKIRDLTLNFNAKGRATKPYFSILLEPASFLGLSNLNSLTVGPNVTFEGHPLTSLTSLQRLYFVRGEMTEVPTHLIRTLTTLEHLHIQGQPIRTVKVNAFVSLNLKVLLLTENEINTLEPGCFNGLSELETLSLSSNELKVLPAVFNGLNKLKKFDVSFNSQLRTIEPNALAGMFNLIEFKASFCEFDQLQADVFSDVPRLQFIDLDAANQRRIAKDTFRGLKDLKLLKLAYNFIDVIEADAFAGLSLTELDLSFTKNLTFPELGVFNNLTVETLKMQRGYVNKIPKGIFNNMLTVKFLDLSANVIETIEVNAFFGLKVTTLDLSHNEDLSILRPNMFNGLTVENLLLVENDMVTIPKNVFNHLKGLKSLDLSRNHIDTVEVNALSGLNLATLDLSRNKKLRITTARVFKGLTVKDLKLSRTNISRIPRSFLNSIKGLESIDLSHNQLTAIDANAFSGLNLTTLNLSHIRGVNVVRGRIFDGAVIDTLKLKHNRLRRLPKNVFTKIDGLKFLDFSSNQIDTIEVNAFFGLNLTTLNLSFNENLKVIKPGMFNGLMVEKLEIAACCISKVQPFAFSGIKASAIDLSSNKLTTINLATFSGLTTKYLDLSVNNISDIVPKAFTNTIVERIYLGANAVNKNAHKHKAEWGLVKSVTFEQF